MKLFKLNWGLILACILFYTQGFSQTIVPFQKRYENVGINGDLTMIGNAILNNSPNMPYNGTGINNDFDMVYVDIDNDPSTFSSSSADFNLASCDRIVYAGLYWGSVLAPSNSNANQVKFKTPGGSYQNITADVSLDDVIYYKDVTTIVKNSSNKSGSYFVANVVSTLGRNMAAGWTLVLVIEGPSYSRKFISTFDGFNHVDRNNNSESFYYTGFKTPPAPSPVEGRVGVAALEGDLRLTGDRMAFRADSKPSFSYLYDAENTQDNFFNSKITIDGALVTNRNLNSSNSLSWDQKIIDLTTLNAGNSILGNDETGVTVRVESSGDEIWTFLNTFAVEIIEPVLKVVTRVEDTNGNEITHSSPVPLGATVWYEITFENVGTDNATNTYILNNIPSNVTLDQNSLVLPAGVTSNYNTQTRQLRFDVDKSLVQKKGLSQPHQIRYQVTASNNCFDYTDACTNLLENSIESYYDGEQSGTNIAGTPGFNSINGCGLGTAGSMDLFVDTSSCSFDSELYLCNDTLTFSGDDGYDTYIWTNAQGQVIGNTKEITVNGPGVYTATQRRTGCTETIRKVTVLGLDVTLTPVDALCKDSADGKVVVKINEASTAYNYELFRNGAVIDSKIGISSDTHTFTGLDIGNYEVRSQKADGCFTITPFSIAEPTLLVASSVKINNVTTCNGDVLNGKIRAAGTGGTLPYTFSIDGGNTYQTEDLFSVPTEKTYEVFVKDANGCIAITTVDVGFDPEILYEITSEDVVCPGDNDGKISINLTNDQGYKVTYSIDGGANYQTSPEFRNLVAGEYNVIIKKEKDLNVCETVKSFAINTLIDLKLEATTDFSCDSGGNLIVASVDPIYDGLVTFTLDGSINQSTGIFENVPKGNHIVTVKHNEYGCNGIPAEVFVEEYIPLDFTIENTFINEYTVMVTGGKPGYEYSFDSPNNFSSDNVLRIRKSKEYTFYVRDEKGCVEEKTAFLEFLDIEIPDFFTPEGDGINDEWYPYNIEIYPNISVKIFDRYQRLIKSYKGNQYSWDGNYENKPLPSGDYWYVIKLNETSDNREYKGHFTLIR
ncbi:T9SS type B sorting domain-containing protein [Namhaeicola litoreus]|uniref:T9SS type B sorting domain-containing protein n=1 Tax=Namhaeicola litoreus TaxID=1052145 RepID=A0ABW3Y3H5_9FLAO